MADRHAAILGDLIDVAMCRGRSRRWPALAKKTLAAIFRLRQFGPHHFEGDGAFEYQVLDVQNQSHAARAEEFQDAIRPQPSEFVRSLRRSEEVQHFAVEVCQGGSRTRGGVEEVCGCRSREFIRCLQWGQTPRLPASSSLTRRLRPQLGQARRIMGFLGRTGEGDGRPIIPRWRQASRRQPSAGHTVGDALDGEAE